jgi:glycerate kinase
MSTQVQYRRGTGAQNDAFTGALAEITVDTTNGTLRVHNGITAGGSNIATVAYVDNAVGSLSADSISNGTSNVKVLSSGGNVAVTVGGSGIVTFAAAGILNNMGNGVGNIGNATAQFNTVFAQATSAQYADVAERYLADADYPTGTVLVFGGEQEVTQSQIDHTTAIAGTVSDKPAYVMNSGLAGDHVVTVALLGRVPVRVIGTIGPGDLLVASELPGIATSLVSQRYAPGCVIGKALQCYDSEREGVIEAVVGRL